MNWWKKYGDKVGMLCVLQLCPTSTSHTCTHIPTCGVWSVLNCKCTQTEVQYNKLRESVKRGIRNSWIQWILLALKIFCFCDLYTEYALLCVWIVWDTEYTLQSVYIYIYIYMYRQERRIQFRLCPVLSVQSQQCLLNLEEEWPIHRPQMANCVPTNWDEFVSGKNRQ